MNQNNTTGQELLFQSLLSLHVPSSYLEYFDLIKVRDKADCYELVLHEKEELVPKELIDVETVLDGFCNEVSVLSHSFSLKKIYLVIRRRRWKPKGGGKHYSNQYNLHARGAKATEEFFSFLKGDHRKTSC